MLGCWVWSGLGVLDLMGGPLPRAVTVVSLTVGEAVCAAGGSWDMEAKALAPPRLHRTRKVLGRLMCVSPFSHR